MRWKKSKKGSQVSMILSFIIFVTAILFIYFLATSLVYQPSPSQGYLDTVQGNLENAITSPVWVLRFYNSSGSGGCFEYPVPESFQNEQAVGMGDSGLVYAGVSGGNISFNGTGFMKIYYSNLIVNQNPFSGSGCTSISPDSVRKESMITEKSITEVIYNFSNSYTLTKSTLGVPAGMDYELSFEYSNGTVIGGGSPVPSTDVYARSIDVEYLSYDGTTKDGTFNVAIW